jgi:flagellar biosynthetic protein FliQ
MNPEAVLDIGMEGVMLAAKLAAPLLQSITQIQEVTLSFVPKAVAVAIALVVCGHWMIAEAVTFTHTMFDRIPHLLSGG